eukprot:7132891-Pyramimonas_sp.AAC.1
MQGLNTMFRNVLSLTQSKVTLQERKRGASKASANRVVCTARRPVVKLSNNNRRFFCFGALVAPLIATNHSVAQECEGSKCSKLLNLSPEEMKAIVKEDLLERKFLATANFTQAIYADD